MEISPTASGYGASMSIGLKSWGRMWLTRFLFSLAVLFGLLLLVVPGLYLGTRFCFAENIVVAEGVSGTTALQRSFDLTRGRFWSVFWMITLTILILVPLLFLLVSPTVLMPTWDHWLVNAGLMLLFDTLAAFATVVFTCAYRTLSADAEIET